jgi:hypothetical protein
MLFPWCAPPFRAFILWSCVDWLWGGGGGGVSDGIGVEDVRSTAVKKALSKVAGGSRGSKTANVFGNF